ncbi:hypothetical protein DCS_02126 [Drechmeria coniospora]|uniref:Uncharacterized protein n=1 Tax=Drechmeria coniospora TaxID=98403 RepID=A0A151GV47_DRECN|nr:hypothetical protein DCS_02126 [Drechmeria coniospora]KYK60986.1 hypothetical protein DCS_02126 [Drechmeria coniospora]ODA83670.1 hypothetical protein RJ55_02185 [Drechmeria coniospora]
MKFTNALLLATNAFAAAAERGIPTLNDGLGAIQEGAKELGFQAIDFNADRFYEYSDLLLKALTTGRKIVEHHRHPPANASFLLRLDHVEGAFRFLGLQLQHERGAIVEARACQDMRGVLETICSECTKLGREIVVYVPAPDPRVKESMEANMSRLQQVLDDITSGLSEEKCVAPAAEATAKTGSARDYTH